MVDSFSTTRSCVTPPKTIAPIRPFPRTDDSMKVVAGAVAHTAVKGFGALMGGGVRIKREVRRGSSMGFGLIAFVYFGG